METKMETNYEGDSEEESGWTSYLETDFSSASMFLKSSTLSNCSSKPLDGKRSRENYRLTRIRTCDFDENDQLKAADMEEEEEERQVEEEGAKGNIREVADEEYSSESSNHDYSSSARASCSTLSDASYSGSLPPSFVSCKRSLKRFRAGKLHQISHPSKLLKQSTTHHIHQCKSIPSHAPMNHLEDTASSSPSSALMHAAEDGASSCSSTTNYKLKVDERQQMNDAVSTRYKVLETLIPRLKEVAGKGKEEEMVKVIGSHVRGLELQVELLSSAWQLCELKRQRLPISQSGEGLYSKRSLY